MEFLTKSKNIETLLFCFPQYFDLLLTNFLSSDHHLAGGLRDSGYVYY